MSEYDQRKEDLIREIVEKSNKSLPVFAELLTTVPSTRNIIRWKNGLGGPITLELACDLARIANMSLEEIATKLGYTPPDTFSQKPSGALWPFMKNQASQEFINDAVAYAIDGRMAYCYKGDISTTLRRLTLAFTASQQAQDALLSAYLQIYLGIHHAILGNLQDATTQLISATQEARREELNKKNDKRRRQAAARIAKRAEETLLWIQWAKGNIQSVIEKALQLIDDEMKLGDYQWLARIHQLLGRAYMNLGNVVEARNHIEKAVMMARLGNAPDIAKHAFFLDHPPQDSYRWRLDLMLAMKTDILIMLDEFDEASDSYLQMTSKARFLAPLNIQNWTNPSWQAHLGKHNTLEPTKTLLIESMPLQLNQQLKPLTGSSIRALLWQTGRNKPEGPLKLMQVTANIPPEYRDNYTYIINGIEMRPSYWTGNDEEG